MSFNLRLKSDWYDAMKAWAITQIIEAALEKRGDKG